MTLNIQNYLRAGHSIETLEKQLGIKATRHPTEPLMTLNYSQLESPKNNPVVMECRGIVLDDNYDLVAKSFNRFFNYGEDIDLQKNFKWSGFTCQEKVDGSLIMMFWYNGRWIVKTRASWCQEKMQGLPMTWEALFWKAFGQSVPEDLPRDKTYVFELCSPYNKVVRHYPDPQVFLLTVVDVDYDHWRELTLGEVDYLHAQYLGFVQRPQLFTFENLSDIQEYLVDRGEADPTWEGVVLRDVDNLRFKIKTPEYLALHRLGSDKDCLYAPKNLVRFILTGEDDELLVYFPEVKDTYEKYKQQVWDAYQSMDNLWYCHHDEASQKKFAMAVKSHPFSGLLFEARKQGVNPKELFLKADEMMIKFLKQKNRL